MKQKLLKLEELKERTIIRAIDHDGVMKYVMIIRINNRWLYAKHLIDLNRCGIDHMDATLDYESTECYALNVTDKEVVKIILEHEKEKLEEETLKQSRELQELGAKAYLIESFQKYIKEIDKQK